jgi:hypothetical protein
MNWTSVVAEMEAALASVSEHRQAEGAARAHASTCEYMKTLMI